MTQHLTAGAIKRAKKQKRMAHAWSLTGGRCVYCNSETPTSLRTVDHSIPRSQGGKNSPTNLLPACYHCNHARGTTCPASRLAHPRWQALVKDMEAKQLFKSPI